MRRYFEPNPLELRGEGAIYEFLGVRFFKKYLLPTELLVNRLRGGKAMQGGQDIRAQLKRLEWETKRNEVIHLMALLLIAYLLLARSQQLSVLQWLLIFAINLYVNVYPIFLQRYNRVRLIRILGRRIHDVQRHNIS